MYKHLFLILFIIGFPAVQFGFAQENSNSTGKEIITIKKDRFLKKTNWLTLGVGYAQKLNKNSTSVPGSLNYYFHIKQAYFNIGIMRSKMDVLVGRYSEDFMTDYHLTAGFRNENRKSSFSYFAGPSYVHGLLDSVTAFSGIGAYAEIQYIQKVYYDIGLGSSIFVNYNRSFPLIGIRLDLYFSNAFRGKTEGR